MNPPETQGVINLSKQLCDSGTTVVLPLLLKVLCASYSSSALILLFGLFLYIYSCIVTRECIILVNIWTKIWGTARVRLSYVPAILVKPRSDIQIQLCV